MSESVEPEVVNGNNGERKRVLEDPTMGKGGTGLLVTVKVTKGEESVEHMGAYPIDAIEFLCQVQKAIELGRSIKTADPLYKENVVEKYGKMLGGVSQLLGGKFDL